MAVLIGRLLLVAVFGLSGVAKLADRRGSRQTARDFGVPGPLVAPVALGLPLLELAIAMMLLPSATASWAAVSGLALLAAFSVAIAVTLAKGRDVDCHCFGRLHSARVGFRTLVRDIALACLAGFVVIAGWRHAGPNVFEWPSGIGVSAAIGIGAGVALIAVLAFQLWFSLQLLRQHGRLLVRLDEIAATLGATAGASVSNGSQQLLAADGSQASGLPPGEIAPAFSLPDIAGHAVTLDDLLTAGRPVILIFSDSHCGPCNALLPQIAEWERKHAHLLTVATISRGPLKPNLRKVKQHGLHRVLIQDDREVAEKYEAHATPSAVIVTPTGHIASRVAQGAPSIEALIDRIVAPPPVVPVLTNGHRRDERARTVNGHGARGPAINFGVGQSVPDATLPDLDGQPVSVTDFTGQRLLLVFWSPHCGYCRQMLPDLRTIDRAGDAQFRLLVISTGEPDTNRDMGLNAKVLLDSDGSAGRALGAAGTPSAILVDGAGAIASPMAVGREAIMTLVNTLRAPTMT